MTTLVEFLKSKLVEDITTNALGQQISNTPDGIENFWSWFGDSVMKNKKGQPCVFYHGSPFKFDRFIPQKIIGQLEGDDATFFSSDKEFSLDFSDGRIEDERGESEMEVNKVPGAVSSDVSHLYEVYLRCVKPFNPKNKKCIDDFMQYLKDKVPNIEDRKDKNSDLKIKSFITGSYPYNYAKDFDDIQVGDILKIHGEFSPLKPCEKVGKVENDVIPNDITLNPFSLPNNAIVFYRGNKTLLVYDLQLLGTKLADCIKINTKNSDVIKRIESSGILLRDFKEKKIPFKVNISNSHVDVECNIIVHKIVSDVNMAPIHRYPSNWEEMETLLITDNISFVRVLKNLGYDSFFTNENGIINIAVFNANDIKSIRNNGEFSETDKFLA